MTDNEAEYNIDFTDITLIEGEGDYLKIKQIMEEEDPVVKGKWVLKSNVLLSAIISGNNFESTFVLDFYANGNVYIIEYKGSSTDVYYNPDITGLVYFLHNRGWGKISPSEKLVKSNIEFWKYFWKTFVIDSDYLGRVFGERDNVYVEEEQGNGEE